MKTQKKYTKLPGELSICFYKKFYNFNYSYNCKLDGFRYKYLMKKILIYNSGGGLGDSIQVIPVIESINKTFVNSKILYLGAHGNHFDKKLKDYKII